MSRRTGPGGPGVDCRLVQRLMGRYHDGDLADDRGDTFEQHLLQCPPCLVEYRRLRVALDHLAGAAAEPVPPELAARLAAAGDLPPEGEDPTP
jgi:anti-sigma factor RsiW